MPVTKEDVETVVALAKLQFSDEEKQKLIAQLNRILDYFAKLNELDTAHVPPTSHVLPLKNVFREDVITPSLSQEEALANAPDRWMDYFKVPKVIE